MKRYMFMAAAAAMIASAPVSAATAPTPTLPEAGAVRHVYLIMMENHSAQEIIGNANAPFMTSEAATANQATSYYGVGHPSLVNYLEVVGGSNFGVTSDYWPAWAKGGCVDNAAGSTGCANAVPPLAGTLFDVATSATAQNGGCSLSFTNAPVINNCAIRDYASTAVTAKTIADQLVEKGLTWKTYQQALPTLGNRIDGVNYADGSFSNLSQVASTTVIPKLYAVKHNPFVYMANVQAGTTPGVTEAQVADFDGTDGLFADLARNNAPSFSFIVPDQCRDIHKLSGTEAVCNQDGPSIQLADAYVKKIVTAIKASKSWASGKGAIIIMFDENDYANGANVVPFIVDKNYGKQGVQSTKVYDHFSLLKTLEDVYGLPCLNHACDATSVDMADLFDRNN